MREYLAMICQPMVGQSDKEIKSVRERAASVLQERGCVLADASFLGEWYSRETIERRSAAQLQLFLLAKSLENMSLCHTVYFCNGWKDSDLCNAVHEAAKTNGLAILYEE